MGSHHRFILREILRGCNFIMSKLNYPGQPPLGPDPVRLTCPHCQQNITTAVTKDPSGTAWAICVVCCLVGCWPCAPCFLCSDSYTESTHKCPNCGKFIGKYSA